MPLVDLPFVDDATPEWFADGTWGGIALPVTPLSPREGWRVVADIQRGVAGEGSAL